MLADESFCWVQKMNALAVSIVNEIVKSKRWFDGDKYGLNLSKTKLVIFANQTNRG